MKPENAQPLFASAKDVRQYLLERTGHALKSNDFDAFLACFQLPQEIHTFEGSKKLNTADDIRRTFNKVRAYFHANHVTDLVRTCVEADYRDPNTIAATHISHSLSGTLLTQDPYPVFSILKKTGNLWRIAHSEYAVTHQSNHSKALID